MQRVMILGAGIYQVPLIQKANEMGLETIVVSIPGSYPGFAFADRVLHLDTRDEEAICDAARRLAIDAIVTTGTDVAMRSIGRVCDELGLIGISHQAASLLTDKALMKQAFREGGVSSSEFSIVESADQAVSAAEALGYPVMMKACDTSGSRGINRAENGEQLREAFQRAKAVSRVGHFVVERVATGTEIGLDAFVWDGRVALCEPHTKYVYRSGSATIPIGHGFPYPCVSSLSKRLQDEVEAIVRATGANNCALNLDLFVDGEDVSIIEAGARCGATTIPELMSLHLGIDYYQEMIRCALGDAPDFVCRDDVPCIGLLLRSPRNGIIRSIDQGILNRLGEEGIAVSLDYGPGDEVHEMRDGTDRIGQLIIRTSSIAEAEDKVSQVLSALVIE